MIWKLSSVRLRTKNFARSIVYAVGQNLNITISIWYEKSMSLRIDAPAILLYVTMDLLRQPPG